MAGAIKISKQGSHVTDASDKDLIFNSDYPLLKIHKQGSGRVLVEDGVQARVIIPHNVGKVPMYFVRGETVVPGFSDAKSDGYGGYPMYAFFGLNRYGYAKVKPYKDRIEILWLYPFITPKFLYFDYFIFEDPIFL